MTITFKTYLTDEGAVFDTKTFDNNADSIKAFFEGKTEIEIKVLGDFGEREVKAVENAGYKIAFTTKAKAIDTTSPGNIFLIPRKAINTYGGKYENLAKIIGVWQKMKK